MASYFFRVEHDLLRSESFQTLGGSAIKVYLVIGLYSDFGSDWAYPSIRTIARQAGLSRQTVLAVQAGNTFTPVPKGVQSFLGEASPPRRAPGSRYSPRW